MERVLEFLKFAGKGERKVVAVFACSREGARQAVAYVRGGVDGLPLWLFTSVEPVPETAALCERVVVEADGLALLVAAQKQLWPYKLALSAGVWTGERGGWPVKLAPLAVPPFRAVLRNRQGDWFAATPRAILRHVSRLARDTAHSNAHRARDIHRAAWLWLAGVLAGACLGALRCVFRKKAQAEACATLRPEASCAAAGIVEFRYSHRQWDRARIEALLETDARWILFLEDGAAADTAGLLAPFDDPRTFAVVRQAGYRDWKPFLLPQAPFRRLQPDEYSLTLAPLSPVVLVDRAKLAALGVPRAWVTGTAWLLLYAKAAASGWRCYTAGTAQPVAESSDRPLEEAEFCLRARPVEAPLARGSIACADRSLTVAAPLPSRDREGAVRPAVLVVSPYLPYPLSHGGAVRIYNLCRALAGKVDFLLACFREKHDVADYARLHEVFREVYTVDLDERASRDSRQPRQVREHASASMRALVADLAPRARLLQVEFTHLAHFREAAPRLPAILVEHDITFTLYRQYAQRHPTRGRRREAALWREFESRWLSRYDAVWTMSATDREMALAAGGPRAATLVVPNGVDIRRFAPAGPPPAGDPEILYIGSFRHRPNVMGFDLLRTRIMPRVWERLPAARLRVVAGPEPEKHWERPAHLDARILVHGFVEDVRPLYAAASVVAVPLVVSAGTNIKVLEAMACGRPVVTTPVGCQGLDLVDGEDALVRAGPEEFADAVCTLLAQPGEAMHARRTVEERFSWDAIAEAAYASYERLMEAS